MIQIRTNRFSEEMWLLLKMQAKSQKGCKLKIKKCEWLMYKEQGKLHMLNDLMIPFVIILERSRIWIRKRSWLWWYQLLEALHYLSVWKIIFVGSSIRSECLIFLILICNSLRIHLLSLLFPSFSPFNSCKLNE